MGKISEKLKYLDPYTYMDMFIDFLHRHKIDFKLLDIAIYIIFSLLLAYLILTVLGFILGTSDAAMIVVSGSMEPTLHIGDIVVLKAPSNLQTEEIKINQDLNNKSLNDIMKINYDILTETNAEAKPVFLLNTKNVDIDDIIYDLKQEGDIIVYYSELQQHKIIHRAIFKLVANDANYYVTKGDNKLTNTLMDADCELNSLRQPTKPCITLLPIPENKVLAKYWFKIPYLGLIKIWTFNIIGLS